VLEYIIITSNYWLYLMEVSMDKKIGILTFQASHNNGSLLQAYALQKVISEKMGYQNKIINFSNKNSQDMYALFPRSSSLKRVIKNLFYLTFYKKVKTHFDDFNRFINSELKLSDGFFETSKDLEKIADNYDILVSGSDQIWNINCYDADDAYFLNFTNNVKKVAYAPSLGANNILEHADDVDKYRNYLMDYSALSIREKNGKKWIEELTGREVELTLDPTMLLKRDEWDDITLSKLYDKEYIFYYAFHYSDEVNRAVKKISEKLNIPVIVLDAKSWAIRRLFSMGFELTEHGGPSVMLSMIKNASLVFTTSYHGTIFSTVFEKPFWFVKSTMLNKGDDRAYTLLEQTGLEERFMDVNKLEEVDLFKPIDYNKVNKKVEKLRESSLEYLKNALENDK
ncbi:polysaccharide pyruvyl transferase family protein, partial [Bacillus sp. JJ1503]|uniref:polysaccharide pyruvyl transferase family protein n=1 Tax=Bacillus sp. JJ1503 TaxID=3122956 RepID=UPI00300014CB